jgi:hypothetical protein
MSAAVSRSTWWTRERKLRALALAIVVIFLVGIFASVLGGDQ